MSISFEQYQPITLALPRRRIDGPGDVGAVTGLQHLLALDAEVVVMNLEGGDSDTEPAIDFIIEQSKDGDKWEVLGTKQTAKEPKALTWSGLQPNADNINVRVRWTPKGKSWGTVVGMLKGYPATGGTVNIVNQTSDADVVMELAATVAELTARVEQLENAEPAVVELLNATDAGVTDADATPTH